MIRDIAGWLTGWDQRANKIKMALKIWRQVMIKTDWRATNANLPNKFLLEPLRPVSVFNPSFEKKT